MVSEVFRNLGREYRVGVCREKLQTSGGNAPETSASNAAGLIENRIGETERRSRFLTEIGRAQ